MTLTMDPDTIGPVDVAVIGFSGDAFNGEIAPALRDMADAGTVRIIDLAFVRKAADGSIATVEVIDSEVAAAFGELDDQQNDLLNDDDLVSTRRIARFGDRGARHRLGEPMGSPLRASGATRERRVGEPGPDSARRRSRAIKASTNE